MRSLEDYFKGLADINRLRIINLLVNGELCGCDIQYVLGASQSSVSRHLNYLKRFGLASDRRAGYRVYYRLAESDSSEYQELIAYLKGAFRAPLFLSDAQKLKEAIKDGACSVSERKLVTVESLQPALSSRYKSRSVGTTKRIVGIDLMYWDKH
jgi:ArsR family transcriptional regulator, arsenate/arsenite/antimonite-responsive transcriptional repressor